MRYLLVVVLLALAGCSEESNPIAPTVIPPPVVQPGDGTTNTNDVNINITITVPGTGTVSGKG